MAEYKKRVILDPGHGGSDSGAIYYGRQEKEDVLNLTLAVGDVLENSGIEVFYTRLADVYHTPYEKATIANNSGADILVSLHRNMMPVPNSASGVESAVFERESEAGKLASNINAALEETGFVNHGVIERPGMALLQKSKMPAVITEVGYMDNEADNMFFDQNFETIADAIAGGIITTLNDQQESSEDLYRVQVGAFRINELANQMLVQLQSQGFPAYVVYEDDLFRVMVGAFSELENAVRMEQTLRAYGYNTYISK